MRFAWVLFLLASCCTADPSADITQQHDASSIVSSECNGTYRVLFDEDLSPEWVTLARSALEEWSGHIPSVLSLTEAKEATTCFLEFVPSSTLPSWAAGRTDVWPSPSGRPQKAVIQLKDIRGVGYPKDMARHEVGHALGLDHVADPLSVMNEAPGEPAVLITEENLRQLRSVWK